METNQKIETQFRAALDATPQEREKSEDLSTGFNSEQDTWEVIVKHTGNLNTLKESYPNITERMYSTARKCKNTCLAKLIKRLSTL